MTDKKIILLSKMDVRNLSALNIALKKKVVDPIITPANVYGDKKIVVSFIYSNTVVMDEVVIILNSFLKWNNLSYKSSIVFDRIEMIVTDSSLKIQKKSSVHLPSLQKQVVVEIVKDSTSCYLIFYCLLLLFIVIASWMLYNRAIAVKAFFGTEMPDLKQ